MSSDRSRSAAIGSGRSGHWFAGLFVDYVPQFELDGQDETLVERYI